MNRAKDTNPDTTEHTGYCPVSGLPVIQKPQWRDVYCSEAFSCSYTIIGDSIIMYQGHGFSDYEAEKKSVDVGNILISKFISTEKPFVVLQDWRDYQGSTFQARKYFIDDMVKQKNPLGVVFFNTTQMQRMSIRMGQAMGIVSFSAWIENDYQAAILRAQDLLRPKAPGRSGSTLSVNPADGAPANRTGWRQWLIRPLQVIGRAGRQQKYIEDLTKFLKEIDWQAPSESFHWDIDPNHPFLPVFDAMIISKSKLDKTFVERDRVEQALRESEARYRELLENANSMVIRWTDDGTITFFNEFAERTLGYKKQELLGRPLAGAIMASVAQGEADMSSLLGDISRNPEQYRYLVRRTYCKDGQPIWVAWNIKAIVDEATGQMQGLGIGSDISPRIEAEEELKGYRSQLEELVEERTRKLRASEEHYREIYRNAPIGIFHCDLEGGLTDCNQAMAQMMGCASAEGLIAFLGQPGGPNQKELLLGPHYQKIARLSGWLSFETQCQTGAGRDITATVTIRRVRGEALIEGFFQDITKRKQAESLLREQAVTDELTGIFNRRKLLRILNDEFKRSSRYGAPLCVCMIDLDDFKSVNDRFGHNIGDQTLKALAEVMCSGVRESDCCGRYGGEEFCLILPHTGLAEAAQTVERIRCQVEQTLIQSPGGQSFSITMSAGLSEFDEHFKSPAHLLQAADQALYQAKEEGKNRVRVFRHD